MARRAICVGINKFARYPQFLLNGCVNDARDMASLCKSTLGFKASEVTVLTDAQATKAAIVAKLKAAIADAKAGRIDYLLFSFSSHGTQMADTSGDEPDGMDEAFVPHDIAQQGDRWDPAHIISDDELNALFRQLPGPVLLEVYLDTCHSGTGLRGAEFSLLAPRPRFIAPPAGELQGPKKQHAVRGFALRGHGGSGGGNGGGGIDGDGDAAPATRGGASASRAARPPAASGANHVLWTGCKANQTSADAYFDGRYAGAFTHHFIKHTLASKNKLSRQEIVARVRADLKGKFTQVPQLESHATNRKSAIAS